VVLLSLIVSTDRDIEAIDSHSLTLSLTDMCNRIEHIPDVWTQLRPSLKKLLIHREADAQLATLRILFVLVKNISDDDVLALLEILKQANFPEHESHQCRISLSEKHVLRNCYY
jgi:hypothetical protein